MTQQELENNPGATAAATAAAPDVVDRGRWQAQIDASNQRSERFVVVGKVQS